MFLCLSIQNDNQNKLFWITEAKMRLKNAFVTFLPSFTGLQWTVHENKALFPSSGRVKYERFSIFQDLWGTLARNGNADIDSGDGGWRQHVLVTTSRFWWRVGHFRHKFLLFFKLAGTNFQKTSPRSQFCHHHLKIVASFVSRQLGEQFGEFWVDEPKFSWRTKL